MTLLEQLQIKHPILLSPMAGVSTPELAAAVSNAGGLGALGLGASTVDAARSAIKATRELTSKAFQVNFFCHEPQQINLQDSKLWIQYLNTTFQHYHDDAPLTLNRIYDSFLENEDFLNLLLEEKPQAVSFHFGLPSSEQIAALKNAGIITMVSVTQLSEAVAAQNANIDILIAQGVEAGGHRGSFNPACDSGLSTKDLVQLLVRYINLPIIAAGGIMNGAKINNYLQLGASAAQLGTAFVQCKESAANQAYRKALFEETITQITDSISGRAARGLFSKWHESIDIPQRPKTPGYPYTYDIGKQLNALAIKTQENGFGAFWAGSNVSEIRALDAEQLMNVLIQEISAK